MNLLLVEQYGKLEEFSHLKIFKSLGFKADSFNTRKFFELLSFRILKKTNKKLWRMLIEYEFNQYVKYKHIDIVIFYNIAHINISILERLKRNAVKIYCYHGDDLYNPNLGDYNLDEKINLIDHHISYRKNLANYYDLLTKNKISFINLYPKVIAKQKHVNPRYDISFIGSFSKKRERYLNYMTNCENSVIAGWGWHHKNCNANTIKPHLTIKQMNTIINSSKVSLNFMTEENRDEINFRNFEIPSQFCCQLSERTETLSQVFKEGESIEMFSCLEEMNSKLDFLLRNDKHRNKIIKKSFELINKSKFSEEFQIKTIAKTFSQ